MAPTNDTQNEALMIRPPASTLTTEERLVLIANLIVDRIMHDEQNGGKLLKQLERQQEQLCLAN